MSEDYKQVTFSDGKRKTYEKIIKEKTAEKKRELSRTLDNKADGLMKKDYPEFLKAIKVKKELELLKKASTEFNNFEDFDNKLKEVCRSEIVKKLTKSTKEGQELNAIDNRVDNILLTLSYPNLKAKAVDLNKALASSENMLSFALNPNTLKQIG